MLLVRASSRHCVSPIEKFPPSHAAQGAAKGRNSDLSHSCSLLSCLASGGKSATGYNQLYCFPLSGGSDLVVSTVEEGGAKQLPIPSPTHISPPYMVEEDQPHWAFSPLSCTHWWCWWTTQRSKRTFLCPLSLLHEHTDQVPNLLPNFCMQTFVLFQFTFWIIPKVMYEK